MSAEFGSFNPNRAESAQNQEFSENTTRLLASAEVDAVSKLSENAGPNGKEKVKNGIRNRLGPYLEELAELADQKESDKYKNSGKRVLAFVRGVKLAATVCSDRRIGVSAITLPQNSAVHRRPGGVAEFRESTTNPDEKEYVMDDHVIAASIGFEAEKQQKEGRTPKYYEKVVAHIDCAAGKGAAIDKATKEKQPLPEGAELEMQSIEGFFDKVRDPMSGFGTDIQRAGGKDLTLISLFDINSQGEIFGLEHVYDEKRARGEKLFNRNKSIPENFEEWEKAGKTLMTATLDKKLLADNPDIANKKALIDAGLLKPLDVISPEQHADSMIELADIAMGITQKYEESEEGFTWIPEKLREGADEDLIRAMALDMVRNSTRRILADIEPGNHNRLKHPEQLTRVGSTGGALNEQTPALIISTPGGELRAQDMQAAQILIPKQKEFAEAMGIDLEKEARIVVVAEQYDADDYNPNKPEVGRKAYYDKTSVAKFNAGKIRALFPDQVANGDLVVVAALHDRGRRMTEILTSLKQNNLSQ